MVCTGSDLVPELESLPESPFTYKASVPKTQTSVEGAGGVGVVFTGGIMGSVGLIGRFVSAFWELEPENARTPNKELGSDFPV